MGTDIHTRLEVLRNGTWEIVKDCMVPNPYYREGAEGEWMREKIRSVSEGGPRNYDAFAILGDVRNGTGFAGSKTGDGFKPLSSRRGMPEGAARLDEPFDDEEDNDAYEIGYLGDHSFSWLTLRELIADDNYWNQSTLCCGYVNARVYANWDKLGSPPSYCGDISGGGIKKVTREETDAILAALDEKPAVPASHFDDTPLDGYEVSHFVFVEWRVTYKESAGYYYSELIPAIAQYAEERGLSHDDVRLVFGFDS